MSAMASAGRAGRHLAARQRQYTLSGAGGGFDLRFPGGAIEWLAGGILHAKVEHALRCALEQHEGVSRLIMM
jgi:hypothetical protein